ncbi:hypothetical protein GOODEAATRI_011148 [Goodea atripinnis]|uniref:Uncharacterized protein n=1 Tax=Goodea atripinnis TaxID=208336 RepID=A0ABV0P375_9TELE
MRFPISLTFPQSTTISEFQFSGDCGTQEKLSLRATDFRTTVHPAAVPGSGSANQSDGSKGRKSGQADSNPGNSR